MCVRACVRVCVYISTCPCTIGATNNNRILCEYFTLEFMLKSIVGGCACMCEVGLVMIRYTITYGINPGSDCVVKTR